jgi:SAM-dependent methyltransferase
MYGGRDEKLLPLEPGHKYFLADPLAPGQGELLDIGCGTGNFLAAARDAGYEVSGTELDRNAARFARERVGLPRVFPLTISEFVERYPDKKFEGTGTSSSTRRICAESPIVFAVSRVHRVKRAEPRALADRARCSGLPAEPFFEMEYPSADKLSEHARI